MDYSQGLPQIIAKLDDSMCVMIDSSAARDRLSDLTSRDGDWFLDELCTMSGNVSQMAGLLVMCLNVSRHPSLPPPPSPHPSPLPPSLPPPVQAMGQDFQPGSVLHSAVEAVNAVHKTYMSLQVSAAMPPICWSYIARWWWWKLLYTSTLEFIFSHIILYTCTCTCTVLLNKSFNSSTRLR